MFHCRTTQYTPTQCAVQGEDLNFSFLRHHCFRTCWRAWILHISKAFQWEPSSHPNTVVSLWSSRQCSSLLAIRKAAIKIRFSFLHDTWKRGYLPSQTSRTQMLTFKLKKEIICPWVFLNPLYLFTQRHTIPLSWIFWCKPPWFIHICIYFLQKPFLAQDFHLVY